MRARRDAGFTVVEIMVVVLILAVLVAIAIPVYATTKRKAQAQACLATRTVLEKAGVNYRQTRGSAAQTVSDLVAGGYVQSLPRCPASGTYVWSPSNTDSGYDQVACSIHSVADSSLPLWASLWNDLTGLNVTMGHYSIINGRLVPSATDYQDRAFFPGGPYTDQRIEMDATLGSGSGYGIYFHATNDPGGPTGYCFQYDQGLGNKFVIRKVVNGVESAPIATSSMPAGFQVTGAQHHTTITTVGSQIVVKVDGVPVITTTDSTFTSGAVGTRSWANSQVSVGQVSVFNP